MNLADRVLHVDAHMLVLDKPAGLAVHPGPRTPHSLEALLPDLRLGARRDPQPVHRLDRDTSGCLLLARTTGALRRLSALFADGSIGKSYWAIVRPAPADDAGTIDAPLLKVSSREAGWRMVVDERGKRASTGWQVLGGNSESALVEFRPQTGRTHQIRVHAAHIGSPIAGDPVYGDGAGPMLLHARRLVVPRADGDALVVEAPLPLSFAAAGYVRG